MTQSDLDNIAYNKFANGEITLAEYIKYKNRDKIMEKKEAMKILKDFHDKSALFSVRTALDTIIPELKEPKESEDERISKEIIYFLSRNTFQFGEDIDKYKSWIAWLEKQGEQKPTEWSEEDELMLLSVIQSLELTNGAAQIKIDWLKSLKQRLGQGLNPNDVIEWLRYHIQVDEPKIEYNEDGQPLAESFIAHAEARCMAADKVIERFKKDFKL